MGLVVVDVERALSLLENKVRRDILERLVREPHYPLQLATQIGVSQQAVTKQLGELEAAGMIQSETVPSDKGGPPKRIYSVQRSFSIRIDLGPDLFKLEKRRLPKGGPMRLRQTLPKETRPLAESLSGRKRIGVDEALFLLGNLGDALDRLDAQRDALIALHQHVKHKASPSVESEFEHYDQRHVIHSMLDSPRNMLDMERVAFELQVPRSTAEELTEDLLERLTRSIAQRRGNVISAPSGTSLPWWASFSKS